MKDKKTELIAKVVLQNEINALKNLRKKIDKSFRNLVKEILNVKMVKSSYLVGKSGIIARKWLQHFHLLAHLFI